MELEWNISKMMELELDRKEGETLVKGLSAHETKRNFPEQISFHIQIVYNIPSSRRGVSNFCKRKFAALLEALGPSKL